MHLPLRIRRFRQGDPRYWVYLGMGDPYAEHGRRPLKLVVEVGKFRPRAGLTYDRGEDHTLMLALGWTLYVSWDARGDNRHDQRWGISLWGEHLSLLWAYDDSAVRCVFDGKCYRKTPRRGWGKHWWLMTVLFGRSDVQRRELRRETRQLIMPEGQYAAHCVVSHYVRTRPRWPWPPLRRSWYNAKIDFEPPVPIPGKGESDYDCDDDATYSLSTEMDNGSLTDTLNAFAIETLRTRQHRGDLDWMPRDGWPTKKEAS